MKYMYMIALLSVTAPLFSISETDHQVPAHFRENLRSYSQNKRELSKLENQKTEVEEQINKIKNLLNELATKLGTTRQELDSVPEGNEPEAA